MSRDASVIKVCAERITTTVHELVKRHDSAFLPYVSLVMALAGFTRSMNQIDKRAFLQDCSQAWDDADTLLKKEERQRGRAE